MTVEVPGQSSLKSAAKTGGVNGTVLTLGETFGRAFLGRGLGTAAGGVVSAAALSGTDRDTAAVVAVERGLNELLSGGSNTSGGNRSRM